MTCINSLSSPLLRLDFWSKVLVELREDGDQDVGSKSEDEAKVLEDEEANGLQQDGEDG